MISIEATGVFSLGRQGENEYRQITFDITDLLDGMDLTGAEVVCLLERPHSAPIICNSFEYDLTAKTAVLTVTSAETANSGRCRLELDLVIGEKVGKTQIYACNVLPALGEASPCTGEIPWVSEVLEASEQAQASAQSASASAQEAQEIADELTDTIGTAVEEYLEEHPITAPVQSVNAKIGDVVLSASDVHALPDSTVIPSKTSDLTNDSGYITSVPVQSVNGKTGAVSLNASDVSALPSSTTIPTKTSQLQNDSGFITSAPVSSVNGQTGAVVISIPTKTSDLTNDSGFITDAKEIFWCTYGTTTSAQIESAITAGKLPCVKYGDYFYKLAYRNSATNHRFVCNYGGKEKSIACQSGTWIPNGDLTFLTTSYTAPVTSVNGQTGAVTIGNATTSSAGLMSATDKATLDSVAYDYQQALIALNGGN